MRKGKDEEEKQRGGLADGKAAEKEKPHAS